MAGKAIHYFASGNTSKGFFSFYDSCLDRLDCVYILYGFSGGADQTFLLKEVGKSWEEEGYAVEYLHHSLDSDMLEGVIAPELKMGVIDGTAPRTIFTKAPGAVEQFVHLGEAWDGEKLFPHKEEIITLTGEMRSFFHKAYESFAAALKVHDEWEKIYIGSMDFDKANKLTEKLINSFYEDKSLNKEGIVRHRFLGAATAKGAVDFIPNLTEGLEKRYYLKGRPGSGKSTMLKKIAAEGEKRGYNIEMYHCGFDPKSIDMIIVRELGIAIFDSTAPHEYFPEREGDEIIDLYESFIEEGTDELFEEQIKIVSKQYKEKMAEAISCLREAKNRKDELDSFYTKATNRDHIKAIATKISGDRHL